MVLWLNFVGTFLQYVIIDVSTVILYKYLFKDNPLSVESVVYGAL